MNRYGKASTGMLAVSMFIFGTIGICRRYILLPSSVLALARGFIGMLFLLAWMLVKRERPSFRAVKRNALLLFVSGAFLGFNWILLFEAYRFTSVATATLCYYMAPVFVLLASPVLLKERLTRRKTGCAAVALVGMVLVSGVLETDFTGSGEWMGILLGLGAAVLYGGLIILNKKIRDIPACDRTIVQLTAATVVLLPYTLFTENLADISFTPFIGFMLLLVGVVHTGLAYALYFGSMKDLKAQTVALFGYIDPITAILLSALLLREGMGAAEIVGTVLVLCATILSEWPGRIRQEG